MLPFFGQLGGETLCARIAGSDLGIEIAYLDRHIVGHLGRARPIVIAVADNDSGLQRSTWSRYTP